MPTVKRGCITIFSGTTSRNVEDLSTKTRLGSKVGIICIGLHRMRRSGSTHWDLILLLRQYNLEQQKRTGKTFQGTQIFKFTEKTTIGGTTFKKGDYFYLDNLHKDHYEAFNKCGSSKGVFNTNGSLNPSKTEKAKKRTGPL